MQKIDLKKELKALYQASAKQVVQVDVPAMNFLMVDGAGDPNTAPAYAAAIEALFMVSYTVKFMLKNGPPSTMASCRWSDRRAACPGRAGTPGTAGFSGVLRL